MRWSQLCRQASHEASLMDVFRNMYAAHGPCSVADFMRLSLTHPTHGYYTRQRQANQDMFGRTGDFITSPEISELFGYTLSVWFHNMWSEYVASTDPVPYTYLELGPGRGTLAADFMRVTHQLQGAMKRAHPSMTSSIGNIALVEASMPLREMQQQTLAKVPGLSSQSLSFHDSIAHISKEGPPLFIVAHEFFDALPVHWFVRDPPESHSAPSSSSSASASAQPAPTLLTQRPPHVTKHAIRDILAAQRKNNQANSNANASGEASPWSEILLRPSEGGAETMSMVRGQTSRSTALPSLLKLLPSHCVEYPHSHVHAQSEQSGRDQEQEQENVVEISLESLSVMTVMAELLQARGGMALIVDYNKRPATLCGTSLMGIRGHEGVDWLENAGSVDLSHWPEFESLAQVFKLTTQGQYTVAGPMAQPDFLLQSGINDIRQQFAADAQEKMMPGFERLLSMDTYAMMALVPSSFVKTGDEPLLGFHPVPEDSNAADDDDDDDDSS